MSPLVRMHPQYAGGGACRDEPEPALVLLDGEEERRREAAGDVASCRSVGRANGRGESVAAKDWPVLSASLPITMPSDTSYPARSDRRLAHGSGYGAQSDELEWGVRSGGIQEGRRGRGLGEREVSPGAHSAHNSRSVGAGTASAGRGGSNCDAVQRTMEIRRMLGR